MCVCVHACTVCDSFCELGNVKFLTNKITANPSIPYLLFAVSCQETPPTAQVTISDFNRFTEEFHGKYLYLFVFNREVFLFIYNESHRYWLAISVQ